MENTARNFTLQLGSLISLFISIPALIALLFGVITIKFPDAALGYYEGDAAASTIRFTIALLIVFFPAYIILTRIVNTMRRKDEGIYVKFTKWLIYLALLVGGLVLLGDLVTVVNGFLNGELTVRFLLKALVVLVVVGVAFTYYLLDAKLYWQAHESTSKKYAALVALGVVASLALGFMHTETPNTVREMRIDDAQIPDLQLIQSHVMNYYSVHGVLPLTLEEAAQGLEIPTAPEERASYTYTVENGQMFKLCAEFAYKTSRTSQYTEPMYNYTGTEMLIKNADNWNHGAGEWCFERALPAPTTRDNA